ncbi:MlaD family protein [Paraconexibacter antarcticus]|uniref:MlaD family protein n=1 Tax=Paraconexibacter antarcticus TaxID=2949664 RepID=A0ABY5DZU6_9ACTN|nr:MlaD family protein [Paraconexibacter antarcticus]UTI66751.1 MlaD family protein [Paraconexibacter antarcticus]
MTAMREQIMRKRRAFAGAGAFVVGAAVLLWVLIGSGGGYTIHARFANAGQLIKGNDVQVAGRKVGTIRDITLTPNGEADVRLSISDGSITPLHQGTRASIRAVGQAGVASRFVDLTLAPPSAPEIADGSVLPASQTTGIVDLDALLDTFGPDQRRDVAALIDHSSQVFAGSGSRYFHSMLGKLDPAMGEVQKVLQELAFDRGALARLIHTGALASRAVAAQPSELDGAVVNAARTFTALAQVRDPLGDALHRAPAVLQQARGTLRRTSVAVQALRPTLRAVPAAAGPLRAVATEAAPALLGARPAVRDLIGQLPALRRSLRGLPQLEQPGVAALRAVAPAAEGLRPILRGLRYYAPDFLLGVTNGLAGLLSSSYNRSGHYARLSFEVNGQTEVSGLASELLTKFPTVPGLLNARTHLLAPCPGSAAPPAPDHSNPWIPDASLCDPRDSIPASVNIP